MKFGVRECANIVFRAKTPTNIGKYKFKAGQPVLYIDTATTSSVEQATTTVYAQGGRGNVRLISWEGEKTLTFTVEDALLSPISLAMLSGADLFQGSDDVKKVHFHTTSVATMTVASKTATIDLSSVLGKKEDICSTNDAPIYVIITEGDGSLRGEMIEGSQVTVTAKSGATAHQVITITDAKLTGLQDWAKGKEDIEVDQDGYVEDGDYTVFVDYYLDKVATAVDELQIAADNFAGNYYVEADTLFRRKSDGVDMPANLTFPNVKIQSNLTFSLSGTGDPSTFTFTMDALPGYTYFDKSREVLCVIQVIEDQTNADKIVNPVMPHNTDLEHKKDEIDDSKYIGYWEGAAGEGTKGNADEPGPEPTTKTITVTGDDSVTVDGDPITLTASLSDSALGVTITWTSSDDTKATVTDSGVVSAGTGITEQTTVTITAAAEGYTSGTKTITVNPAG